MIFYLVYLGVKSTVWAGAESVWNITFFRSFQHNFFTIYVLLDHWFQNVVDKCWSVNFRARGNNADFRFAIPTIYHCQHHSSSPTFDKRSLSRIRNHNSFTAIVTRHFPSRSLALTIVLFIVYRNLNFGREIYFLSTFARSSSFSYNWWPRRFFIRSALRFLFKIPSADDCGTPTEAEMSFSSLINLGTLFGMRLVRAVGHTCGERSWGFGLSLGFQVCSENNTFNWLRRNLTAKLATLICNLSIEKTFWSKGRDGGLCLRGNYSLYFDSSGFAETIRRPH